MAHADWSVDAGKRWMTVAGAAAGDRLTLFAPVPVGDVATLPARLRGMAAGGSAVLGLDLPLGLPRAYAAGLDAADFLAFLRDLARRPEFFRVCAALSEISRDRPFYPMRGVRGMTRVGHATALGLDGSAALSRRCDRATADRPAGAPLFWTLGANQTGKAALAAWRDCLIPALTGPDPPLLWPFDGDLHKLLRPGALAVAETYPAEAMRHLGVRLAGSKRGQAHCAGAGPALLAAMARLDAEPDDAMRRAVADGFGADAAGEDRFDCVLGVLCVINVLRRHRPDGIPVDPWADPWLRRWEGWVLGQTGLPASPRPRLP